MEGGGYLLLGDEFGTLKKSRFFWKFSSINGNATTMGIVLRRIIQEQVSNISMGASSDRIYATWQACGNADRWKNKLDNRYSHVISRHGAGTGFLSTVK